MNLSNKEILLQANHCVSNGDNEGFLSFCTDDIEWTFVGDKTLKGKEAIRQYMAIVYTEAPKFDVENLIEENDFVTAIGKISMKDNNGILINYSYCDVWQFSEGKMASLKAFVIQTD